MCVCTLSRCQCCLPVTGIGYGCCDLLVVVRAYMKKRLVHPSFAHTLACHCGSRLLCMSESKARDVWRKNYLLTSMPSITGCFFQAESRQTASSCTNAVVVGARCILGRGYLSPSEPLSLQQYTAAAVAFTWHRLLQKGFTPPSLTRSPPLPPLISTSIVVLPILWNTKKTQTSRLTSDLHKIPSTSSSVVLYFGIRFYGYIYDVFVFQ